MHVRPVCGLIALLSLLSACQLSAPGDVKRAVRASVKPPVASQAPEAPAPSPRPLAVLQKPTGETQAVSGLVAVDASYMVTAGAGQVISNNGAKVVAAAGILSSNGASLLEGAGNLLSNNGGSLISDKGANYRLSQAENPPLGQILPAAGLALRVVSLLTGTPVSVGVDAENKPVYSVLTDARGAYTLYLPPGLSSNVRIEATVPGHPERRLAYGLLTAPGTGEQTQLDEDSAAVNQYIRSVAIGRLESLFLSDDSEAVVAQRIAVLPPHVQGNYRAFADLFQATAQRNGTRRYAAADRQAVLQQVSDTILAELDFSSVTIVNYPGEPVSDQLAFPELVALLGEVRERITVVMNRKRAEGGDPTAYFAAQAYLKNKNPAGQPALFEIKKPADFNDFIVRAYLADIAMDGPRGEQEIADFVETPELGIKAGSTKRMMRACGGVGNLIGVALFLSDLQDPKSAARLAIDVLDRYQPQEPLGAP